MARKSSSKKIKLADPIKYNDEYHSRELREAIRKEEEVASAPLSERQEARSEFGEALKDPALIGERVGWLIDGNYGFGPMLLAKRIVASPRTNRRAALTQLVATHEWSCPASFAVDAWKKLSGSEKQALDAALDIVIEAAEAEMASEQGE